MMSKRILSFDVGIKNLSFADLAVVGESGDANTNALCVVSWGVLDTRGADARKHRGADATCMGLLETLRETFFTGAEADTCYDAVLIENQPAMRNPVMKSVQVALYTYFQTLRMLFGCVREVHLVSASVKLAVPPAGYSPLTNAKLSYAAKKATSVEWCAAYLSQLAPDDARAADALASARKKDDLADAFLQGLAFLRKRGWLRENATDTAVAAAAATAKAKVYA